MKQTWYTRWFNWRWRPANIWGRYRLRRLPTMTPEAPDEARRISAFAQALGLTVDHLAALLESYGLRLQTARIDGSSDA